MYVCISGLSIYSDSESEDEVSEVEGAGGHGDTDSDEELRQTIRRKHREFQATERDILRRLESEEMEERSRNNSSANVQSDSDGDDKAEAGEGEEESVKRWDKKDGEGDRFGEQIESKKEIEEALHPTPAGEELYLSAMYASCSLVQLGYLTLGSQTLTKISCVLTDF